MGQITGRRRGRGVCHLRRRVAMGAALLLVMLLASSAWSAEKMRWIDANAANAAKGQALFAACGACPWGAGRGPPGHGAAPQ